ncbi:MAG: hypothetical protein IRY91_16215, partial [Gemmatimonadaceae bacterium]|nr:hypothetical protein [Gemmatimonadaceae bacterium]
MEDAAFGVPGALNERRASAPSTTRAAAWERALGARWPIVLGAYLVLAVALAALMPLRDIDLPMHLAIGEWIARHHAVPFTEPLAWTRWGAPYYAYSWLAQVTAYGALAVVGPVGVHLMYAAIVAAAVVAVMLFGRLEGWRPWPTLLAAVLHFVVLTRVTPSMRPQVALWALVPLAWVGAAWLRRSRGATGPLATLFVVSALAANTHLLFPLTGVPVLVLLANPPAERRRALWGVVAVGAGWLCSPYGFVWPEVFRLNFAPNPLFRYPSPIMEYRPGFVGSMWVGVFLAALPWL